MPNPIRQACGVAFVLSVMLASMLNAEAPETYTNPVVRRGQDPWIAMHGGRFYYCYSKGRAIGVRVAKHLEKIGKGKEAVVWRAPESGPYSNSIWAPELHRIGENWYIYFAADDGDNRNHRMYVLRSEGDDPLGPYTFVGKVADRRDRWAIDGTVYEHDDGRLFFIWSGWPGDASGVQNLYIAPMSDAVTVSGDGVLISTPEYGWERVGDPKVNEGPQVLKHGNKVHVIYSASGSWTDDYCLGRLTLIGDNPMDPASWRKHPEPVFSKTGSVFGPGHAGFVHLDNADGPADWIVYHSARNPGAGWDRAVNLQPFTWDEDGNPVFGEPIAPGVGIDSPRSKPAKK